MFYTYILRSIRSGKHYVGLTNNIDRRLKRHNDGRNKSTKIDRPWVLIYKEEFATKQSAYRREKQIKSYKSGVAFKKLVGEN